MALNVALAANGGVVNATNYGSGPGTDYDITWGNDGGSPLYTGVPLHSLYASLPQNVEVIFSGSFTIGTVVVWCNDYDTRATDPTTETGTGPVLKDFLVRTWDGSAWVTQATITGNTLLKRVVTFTPIATTKIRVQCNTAISGAFALVQEIQAFTDSVDSVWTAHGAGGLAVVPRGPLLANLTGHGSLAAVGQRVSRGAAAFAGAGSLIQPLTRTATNILQTVANCKAWTYWGDSSYPSLATLSSFNLDPSTFGGTPVWRAAITDNNTAVSYTTVGSGVSVDTDTVHVFIPPTGVSGHLLADTLVIYSSSVLDRSFGFGDPEHHGLVGRSQTVDESIFHLPYVGQILAIYFHGSDVPAGISYDPANARQITFIQNNRQTRLEVRLVSPAHVAAIQIRGGRLLNAAGGFDVSNILQGFALDVGTIIKEIQLLSSRTVYTAVEVSSADARSSALRVSKQAYVSTADATAVAIGKRSANLVSSANATAVNASRAKVTQTLVSGAAASDAAKGVGTVVLQSNAVATSALALLRHATLQSSAQAANVISTKLTHAEVSSAAGEAETTAGRSIGQTEVSTANATSTFIGKRKVTATEVSSAAGSDSNAAHALVLLTLQSEAHAVSTLVTHAQMRVTAVSTAKATDTVRLPGMATSIFWTNTQNLAAAVWEGLPFNSLLQVDTEVYAADTVGVRKLAPKANDLATVIESEVAWDLTDYGSSKMKRLRSVYIHGTADGPFRFRVIGEQGGFDYQSHLATAVIATQHRAPLGRGWNSVNYRFGLLQDHYFSLSGVIVEMGDTTRRI